MTAEDIYNESVEKWKLNRGKGTLSYAEPLSILRPAAYILNKYYDANPKDKVIVVVYNNTRIEDFTLALFSAGFKHTDKIHDRLLNFMLIDNIIASNYTDNVQLIIFDQIDRYSSGKRLEVVAGNYIKFKYALGLTNIANPDNHGFGIYAHCRLIHRITKVDIITHGLIGDVIEYNLEISMSEQDAVTYQEYNQFIKDTTEIFGDFDTAMKCYHGDPANALSGDFFRAELAMSKGWNKNLDLSIEYYASIDRYYSPSALYERAKVFTEVIQKRARLITDNNAKVDAVLEIVKKYRDKKILIMAKRSSFAKVLNENINARIESNFTRTITKPKNLFSFNTKETKGYTILNTQSVEYHPDVETKPLVDPYTGDYIRIKTGANAGSIKQFGATSLNKIANEEFNKGYHNVVCANDAIPKEADFTIDFIIITSAECNSLKEYQYRVSNLSFIEGVKIINLALAGTKEIDKLTTKQSLTNNKVIKINDVNELNL